MPRPGAKVPIKFATTSKIDGLEDIAVDFFDKIHGYNYYECFISDESHIFNFDVEEVEI